MDYARDESAIFTESKGQRQVNTAVTLTIINWYRLHYYEAQIMLRLSKLTEVVDPCSQPRDQFSRDSVLCNKSETYYNESQS